MKKLLIFLLPIMALGLVACPKSKESHQVTIVCKNIDSETRATIHTGTVLLREGTYVDGEYIADRGLMPPIDGYEYHSFEGPAGRVGKGSTYVLLYTALRNTLTVNYRHFEAPDEPLAEAAEVAVPIGEAVDREWMSRNGHIPSFEGLVFRSMDPAQVTMDRDRSVTVFYDTQVFDYTVRYRRAGEPETELAPDAVAQDVGYGTVLDREWLAEAGLMREFEHYNLESVELTAADEITVWYAAKNYPVVIRHRDIDGNVSLGQNTQVDMPYGTVVDEGYVRGKGYVRAIYGYEFAEVSGGSVAISESLINYVDLLYRKKQGSVTIEYWKSDPLAEPVLHAESDASELYHVNDVIADYDQLVADGAIFEGNIPEGYEFASMEPADGVTVAEGATVIKVYYKPEDIPVRIRYWKGKKDQVGTTLSAVDDQATIPNFTEVVGETGYRTLVDMGSVKPEYIPDNYLFDEIDAVSVTEQTSGTTINIYYTNHIPVTIVYYKGEGEVYARDETQEMIYGSPVSSYEDMAGYINEDNIPAGYVFGYLEVVPATTTIDREGIVIRLIYVEQQ